MIKLQKEIIILFFSLFLIMVGFGIIIPVLPFLVLSHEGGSAAVLGLLMASYSLMQFFFAPIWGRLSDRIGRKPVLMIGLAGFGFSFIAFGLAGNLWILFICRIISGIVSSATLTTAIAYIADITTRENRTKAMSMMGAAMNLGIIFGPALGGWLAAYGISVPFLSAGVLAILALPFTHFFLKESLKEFVTRAEQKKARAASNLLTNPLLPLLALSFIVSFSMALFESTFALFTALRAGLKATNMGFVFTVLGLFGVITQAGLIPVLNKRLGDVNLIRIGTALSAAGLLLFLLSTDLPRTIIFSIVFSLGSSLLRPSISTLIANNSVHGHGASIGLMQSSDSLGRILGPVAGGLSFEFNPFLPNSLAAGILIIILIYSWPYLSRYKTR